MKRHNCVVHHVFFLVFLVFPLTLSFPRDVLNLDSSSSSLFDTHPFDAAFSRADREARGDRWLQEAQKGRMAACSAWERSAAFLYQDGALPKAERDRLELWSEAEMERRFSAWLQDRFFGEQAQGLAALIAATLENANKDYLYLTDSDGKILYDGATGDPLLIRPMEGNEQLEADAEAWKNSAAAIRTEALSLFSSRLNALRPELLAFLDPEQKNSLFEASVTEAARLTEERIAGYLDALLSQEERLFVSRRTADLYSQRHKSEAETASCIAIQIAEETRSSCDADIQALQQRIESLSVSNAEIQLDQVGREWLELFKDRFAQGMSAWENAEERFMLRRLEWERDASARFTEGDAIWEQAFERLALERRAWEAKARSLFDSGEERFRQASENLETSIAEARAEFEQDARLRTQLGADKARVWVETFICCSSLVTNSVENAEYWLAKAGWKKERGDPVVGNEKLKGWITVREKNHWNRLRVQYERDREYQEDLRKIREQKARLQGSSMEELEEETAVLATMEADFRQRHSLWFELKEAPAYSSVESDSLLTRVLSRFGQNSSVSNLRILLECKRWNSLYEENLSKASSARSSLLEQINLGFGSDSSLLDILKGGVAGEDLFLDEYQIELIRAQAISRYWEKRVLIADAVVTYAEDISAFRITDAESLAAWKKAKAEYETALSSYTASQSELENAGNDLALAQGEIRSFAAKLSEADAKLTLLNEEYALSLAALKVGDNEFIKDQIASYNEELFALSALINLQATDSLSQKYIDALCTYGQEEIALRAGELLSSYAHGEEEGFSSLDSQKDAISLFSATDAAAWYISRTGRELGSEDLEQRLRLDLRIAEDSIDPEAAMEKESAKARLAAYMSIAPYSAAFIEEQRLSVFKGIQAIFSNSGIELEAGALPNAETIAGMLSAGSGSFVSSFMDIEVAVTEEVDSAPFWFALEIQAWLKEVHNYLVLFDSPPPDALEDSERARALAEGAYQAWGQHNADRLAGGGIWGDLDELARSYEGFWEVSKLPKSNLENSQAFLVSRSELEEAHAHEFALKAKIKRLEEISENATNTALLTSELENMSSAISVQRLLYDQTLGDYARSAEILSARGKLYDSYYQICKDSFSKVEEAELKYEKEDAIRRWAASSYLDVDNASSEKVYVKANSERANVALKILAALYDEDASERPYNDDTYNELYSEYRLGFERMLLVNKACEQIASKLNFEKNKNVELYNTYLINSNKYVAPLEFGSEFKPPENTGEITWKHLVTLSPEGKLCLNYNSSFILSSNGNIEALQDYFKTQTPVGLSTNQATAFEKELIAWSTRMGSYALEGEKLFRWGYAKDYLFSKLAAANGNSYPKVSFKISGADDIYDKVGSFRIRSRGTINDQLDAFRTSGLYGWDYNGNPCLVDPDCLNSRREAAWNSLSDAEKNDLEFYLVLSLASNGKCKNAMTALDLTTKIAEYDKLNTYVQSNIRYEKNRRGNIFYGWLAKQRYNELCDMWEPFESSYQNVRENYFLRGGAMLKAGAASVYKSYAAYTASCSRVAMLEASGSTEITWDDLNKALLLCPTISEKERDSLKETYVSFIQASNTNFSSVSYALERLSAWTRQEEENMKQCLENKWRTDESKRLEVASEFQTIYEHYIDGKATRSELALASNKAFGHETASFKKHLSNIADVLKSANNDQKNGNEYVQLIQRISQARYQAELASRNAEWDCLRRDLNDKIIQWRAAAEQILSRGRSDWKTGQEQLNEAYADWSSRFIKEYTHTDTAWNLAWLEAMKEKNSWVQEATEIASQASNNTMASLVCNKAQTSARHLDGINFCSTNMDAKLVTVEVEEATQEALNSIGITKVSSALELFGSTGTAQDLSSFIRKGIGSVSAWDTAKLQVAAATFAHKTKNQLASSQALIIASQAKDAAQRAVIGLKQNVLIANKDFEKSMDETFEIQGGWKRSKDSYNKNILVHTTVFDPYIFDHVQVSGYKAYTMSPWSLRTDLSEQNLKDISADGIWVLVGKAQEEVEDQSKKIFGEENKKGELGLWIGAEPTLAEEPDLDDGIDSVWSDPGSGQLGRLMQSYIYWSLVDAQGWKKAAMPIWDKALWDSRGSSFLGCDFEAPSIRSSIDLGLNIATCIAGVVAAPVSGGTSLAAAVALSTAINSADDAVFTLMDVNGGYRSWEDAGLDFGKKLAISAGTSVIGAGFGGATTFYNSGSSGLIGKLGGEGIKGVMGTSIGLGLQNITSSNLASAVNAVYWNGSGLDWSNDTFNAGLKDSFLSTSSSIVSSFTGGLMNLGLEGFTGDLYTNGTQLSKTFGNLSGQGLSYALDGKATFNVANLDLFGIQNKAGQTANLGLLEFQLGKKGSALEIGSGGANISLGSIASSLKGFEAWAVNAELLLSNQEESKAYTSALRTLYSGGTTERDSYIDIVKGKTNIVEDGKQDFAALSTYDSETGTKLITLGRDALTDGSRFGQNILLAHEAHRDGLIGPGHEQQAETNKASLAHIRTAASLASTYGLSSLSSSAQSELAAYRQALSTGEYGEIERMMSGYDSSADYWRLKKDGSLVNDGKATLTVELADGNTKIFGTDETSQAAALIHYLGEDRARELLGRGSSVNKENNAQTLVDVMGISRAEAEHLTNNPAAYLSKYESLNKYDQDRILGETLMKSKGMSFSEASGWSGNQTGFHLSDNKFKDYTIGVESMGNMTYQYFTITGDAKRSSNAFSALSKNTEGEWQINKEYVRNTSIDFTKRDLSGTQIGKTFTQGAWNTVDTGYGQLAGTYDQTIHHATLGDVQSNTVNSNFLAYMDNMGGTWGHSNSFVITQADTIGGEHIGPKGVVPGSTLKDNSGSKWRWHAAGTGVNDGCWVLLSEPSYVKDYRSLSSPDSGASRFNSFTDHLQNMGLYNGMNMHVRLNNENLKGISGFNQR
ncbi:hypothetical protein MASR2M78_17770 [Treponema sp.]